MEQPTIQISLPGFGMNVHLTVTEHQVRIEQVLTATGETNKATAYSLAAFQSLLIHGSPNIKTLDICEKCWGTTVHNNHVCGDCYLAGHGSFYYCDDCGLCLTSGPNVICSDCIDQRIRDKESMEWLGDDSEREEA